MELLITLLLVGLSLRAILLPVRWGVGIAVHAGLGFASLWLLNLAGEPGIPVNAVTVLTAGILGIPGVGLLAALVLL